VRSLRAAIGLPLILSSILCAGCLDVGRGGPDVAAPDVASSGTDAPSTPDTPAELPEPAGADVDALDVVEDGTGTPDAIADVTHETGGGVDADPADGTQISDSTPYKGLVEWTVLVYLNGDNSLSEDAVEDLQEMAAAGWSPSIRVVVLLDTLDGETVELVLGPEGFEPVDEPGELDLGDWRVLRDFAVRGVETHPAKRYALIVWNHGDGWDKPAPPLSKSFSSDDSGAAGSISVAGGELTAALDPVVEAAGRPLDLLGMDMCLLGMWEVAVAAEGAAEILVASEENEPADGWDYTGLLAQLNDAPETEGAALAAGIVERYHGADAENSTLSAVALPALPAVSDAVASLAMVLAGAPEQWAQVEEARVGTQRFDDDYSKTACPLRDLYHLTERLDTALEPSETLQAATAAVREAMDLAVLANAHQSSHPNAHGLAIHFPPLGSHFRPTYLDDIAPWSGHPWTAFLSVFGAPVCPEWTCKWSWFGGGDGCDCACGCWDPDCDAPEKVYHCADDQVCAPPGLCQDAPGACIEGTTQCAGDLLVGTCVDGAWSLAPCASLITCPGAASPAAFCWDGGVDGAPGACLCAEDPVFCAGVQCGENDLGLWCGTCRAGLHCHDGTCFDQGGCPGDEVLDCLGICGDADWLGDDVCDDGKWGVDFNCEGFDFDDGDCS
jgi:hypothetical protein